MVGLETPYHIVHRYFSFSIIYHAMRKGASMNINDFVQKYKGKGVDFDGQWGGQCVDLFRYYCHEVLQIKQPAGVWGAANFWTNFDTDPVLRDNFTKISNTADFVPLEGDVAVWNFNAGGGYGHIAIVIGSDHTKSYFHSFDQNWSRVSYSEIVKHTYTNLYGVLRPKQIPEGELMEIEKELFEKLVNKSTKYDEFVAMGFSDPNKVKEEIEKLKLDIKSYDGKIKELNSDIFILQQSVATLNEELENCSAQIPGEEDLEQNYEVTGRKIIKTVGDTIVETSFKRKA